MRWAVVEVMGHRVYVGQVEEVTVAGAPMLRVWVPEVEREHTEKDYGDVGFTAARCRTVRKRYPAYDVDLGGGSLFAVTRCSEGVARARIPSAYRPDGFEPSSEYGPWTPATGALLGLVEDAEVVLDEDDAPEYDAEYGAYDHDDGVGA